MFGTKMYVLMGIILILVLAFCSVVISNDGDSFEEEAAQDGESEEANSVYQALGLWGMILLSTIIILVVIFIGMVMEKMYVDREECLFEPAGIITDGSAFEMVGPADITKEDDKK